MHIKDAKSPKSRRLGLIAAVLSVLFAVVLIIIGPDLSTGDDDMGIALALSGLYPNSGLSLFVNAFVSRLTLLVSGLFPGINAFFVLEYCLVLIGVFVFVYVAVVYLDDHVIALCAIGLFFMLLIPGGTYRKNFTVVATLISLAGFFALTMQVRQSRPSIPLSIVAVILCVFGFMIRRESFLLTLPFVAVAVVYEVWANAGRGKLLSGIRETALRLVPFALVVVLCASAFAYDAAQWKSPEWSEWKSFNHARSAIIDYPMPKYSEIAEELSAGGIAEIDYSFSRSWRIADKDVFTTDSLEFISSFSGEVGDEVVAEKMLTKAQKWVAKFWYSIPIALVLLVLYILRARRLTALSNVTVAIVVLLFAAVTFYLASGGRLPQRVMYSVIADAVICLAVVVSDRASISKRHQDLRSLDKSRRIACAISLAFCMVSVGYVMCTSFVNSGVIGSNASDESTSAGTTLAEYIGSNDDTLFVVDASVASMYFFEYDMERIPPQDELTRLFLLGGWSTGSPYINARNEMMDMGNVMKGLVDNDRARYLVPESGKKRITQMETYLETHYWNDVEAKVVDRFEVGESEYLVYDFEVVS